MVGLCWILDLSQSHVSVQNPRLFPKAEQCETSVRQPAFGSIGEEREAPIAYRSFPIMSAGSAAEFVSFLRWQCVAAQQLAQGGPVFVKDAADPTGAKLFSEWVRLVL